MQTPTQDLSPELVRLLERIALNDPAALEQLYQRTSSKLFGLALRILEKQEWAEDVLQESFVNIWRHAGDYRAGLASPMTWLSVIVRNRSLDYLRRHAAERIHTAVDLETLLETAPEGELADHLKLDAPGPAELVSASQDAQALARCMKTLENRQRQAISLAYLKDYSHTELSATLGVPLGTVKSWIRRGLDKLRTCLEGVA